MPAESCASDAMIELCTRCFWVSRSAPGAAASSRLLSCTAAAPRLAQELPVLVFEQLADRRVHALDGAVGRPHEQRIAHRVQDVGQALFALAQLLFHRHAAADVADDAFHRDDAPRVVAAARKALL